VKQLLTLFEWFHFHILQGLGSFLGIPDRIAIKNGRVLFLEIKKPGGKLSPGQIIFRDLILSHGGEYYRIDDLNKLIEVLEEKEVNAHAHRIIQGLRVRCKVN